MRATRLAATFVVAVSLSLGFVAGIVTYGAAHSHETAETFQRVTPEPDDGGAGADPHASHARLDGDLECWTDCWYDSATDETVWESTDVLADDYRSLMQARDEQGYRWHGAAMNLAVAIGEGCTVYEDLSYTCPDGTSGSELTDLVEGNG